ncbi:disease resistance protein Roq1 isoform X1 [Nicotiana tabacum]|uniref:ADP-ribosyl cyclase/cyclic ADP-ribose hydrolase n=3 Tax=Nicotiana tabacum TaxID=4097 RepID=A0A1S4A4Y4_TOBAC|nr:PREDICTED: TMV resistance protein N-like isoform X1 [Nicotiana tabacum]
MASTSSPTQNWKNDVFLSFRGEDTRKTFVGHLYYALKHKGIHTFKDDVRLERGKSISPELVKAIEQSRFAIVVFSKNYASSTWCLDELVKIMKCKKELGLTVMPIFYDVDPSDVSKQSGTFAESFSRHEENLRDDLEKVQCWRDAFGEAGKTAGYDLPNGYDGYESNCIQHVVEDILGKLCQVTSTIDNDLVGMESRVREVSSLLRMETHDVRFIGIWGMGGIGKTTIASAVFGKYSGLFEGVCFLDNVAEMQRTYGLQYLQGVLLSKILKVSLTITSVYEGMEIIKKRLRTMKVLIILDDVNQKDQLKMLVGWHDWFGSGSRILITTRDKHLLDNHIVDEVYSVNLMTLNEAIELFSLHAFKQRIPKKDFEELSNQVVHCAALLPLALKVLGSFLYGLDRSQWRSAWESLKDLPNDEILAKLKISFEGLGHVDQRLFLDIACFYRGKLRSYVEEILESCDIGSTIRIKVLIEKSLLFISPYDTIEMHDLIQEMAWHIVSQDDSRRSRIWLPEDIEDLFTGNLEAESVEGLWIPRNYIPKQDISYYNISEAFRRMKRLRVLVVRATNFCSIDPITHLPSSLRWLDWEACPLNSLPQSFEPSKLLRLDILECSTLQKLWLIPKGLDKLKTLYLSYCEHLEEVPSFELMPNLERVKLEGCKSLREVSPSFGVLMKLTSLELIDCQSLEKLPSYIQMESLKSLKLSCLPKLRELPETKGLHRLLTLELTDCQSLEMLPSCNQMESLVILKLSCLPKIMALPATEGMHHLLELVIEYTPIVELPVSIGNLGSLKQLWLSHCKDLVSIPNSFSCLKNLRVLVIYNCKRFADLPEKMGDLKLLEKLVISGTAISRIPPSVADLGELSFLSFSRWFGYREDATFLLPSASGSSSFRVLKLKKHTLCSGEHFQDLGCLSSLAHLDFTRNDFTSFNESNNQPFHYLDITFCEKLVLPRLPACIKELYAYDPLVLKSIPDFPTKYSELYSVSFAQHIENRGELTDILHFVLRLISAASQCEKVLPFSIFSPGDIRWSGFNYYRKEHTKRFSTPLDPCWYESKFKGFVICFRVPLDTVQNQKPLDAKSRRGSHWFGCTKVTVKLVQRYDRQEQDVLQKKCLIVARQAFCSHSSKYAICFSYIPFVALWHTSDSEKGKKPNDYCFFEASIDPGTATKWGLLLVYENKIQQIDQSTIVVQRDVESPSSDLLRESNDDQGQKTEDASVKRRRLDICQRDNMVSFEAGCSMKFQAIKDSCSPSEFQTFQIIPDQQLETPCSSAAQSFRHREESCSSGQPQTLQLPLADPQVDEVINEATSGMVFEQLEAPSSSEQPESFEVSPDEHKDNSVTNGSSSSEVFQELEAPCSSGQPQILQLFPEHS